MKTIITDHAFLSPKTVVTIVSIYFNANWLIIIIIIIIVGFVMDSTKINTSVN